MNTDDNLFNNINLHILFLNFNFHRKENKSKITYGGIYIYESDYRMWCESICQKQKNENNIILVILYNEKKIEG